MADGEWDCDDLALAVAAATTRPPYTLKMPNGDHESATPQPPPVRLRFTHAHRLHGDQDFQAVFANKLRKNVGPLAVLALPNKLQHHRLGLTVSRRVGNAVKRHRIKRLLREAFRINQHTWLGCYDLVIIVHPHDTLKLKDYEAHLSEVLPQLHRVAEKRRNASAGESKI